MILQPIPIDPELLLYIAEALNAIPERLCDIQKIKTLSVGNRPVFHRLIDFGCEAVPKQFQIVPGDFSVLGEMPRLKNLSIFARDIKVFPKLSKCAALEKLSLERIPIGFDCAELIPLELLKSFQFHCYGTPADLAALGNLKKLQRLSLECEEFESLYFLEQLNSLQTLKIKGHGVFDCNLFNHLPDLKEAEFAGDMQLKHLDTVNQARIKLMVPPVRERKVVSEKKPIGWGRPIPFQFPEQMENYAAGYEPAVLSSSQWDTYSGAYGSVQSRIAKLLLRDEEFEYHLECLCSELSHQMSFYSGTYLAIPHLAVLLREAWTEKNTMRQYQLIRSAGIILATDTPPHIAPDEIAVDYGAAVEDIALCTRAFLATNLAITSVWEADEKKEFVIASLAILGDRSIAFVLTLLGWNDYDVMCPQCGHSIENIKLDKRNTFVKPEPVPKSWDGKNTENTYLWVHNLLQLLGAYKAAKLFSNYFGTYRCPKCEAELSLMDGIKYYFIS